jgi:hypothetical protein
MEPKAVHPRGSYGAESDFVAGVAERLGTGGFGGSNDFGSSDAVGGASNPSWGSAADEVAAVLTMSSTDYPAIFCSSRDSCWTTSLVRQVRTVSRVREAISSRALRWVSSPRPMRPWSMRSPTRTARAPRAAR